MSQGIHGLGSSSSFTQDNSHSFSGALVLAQILEGGEGAGILSGSIRGNGETGNRGGGDGGVRSSELGVGSRGARPCARTLGDAVASLSSHDRETLHHQVGNHLNEFLSLSRETDPELFYEGLYNLGVRLEQSGHTETAASVYSTLSTARPLSPAPLPGGERAIPSNIQHQAEARLAALRGEGSVGLRLEVLGRSFARQAMAPAPLIGMGVAGLAFRGMNLFAATRLANLSAGLLTRGPGLRVLSGLVGFAAEVPAFTFGTKFASSLLGEEQDYSAHALRTELASGALVLGSLKLFGLGFGQLGNRLNVGAHGRAPVQVALQQAGMLTGIMAGHGLEVAFGLRERQAASLFLAESLVTLAQFNVAGRLSHSVFGERYARLQQSLAVQAEAVGKVRGSPARGWSASGGEFGVRSRVQNLIEQMRNRLNGPPLAGATVGGGKIGEGISSDTSILQHPDTIHDGRLYSMGIEGGEGSGGGGKRIFNPRTGTEVDNPIITRPDLNRVLIPNRGEIAVRISRGLKAEGVTPVVLVTGDQMNTRWVREIRELGGEIREVPETPALKGRPLYTEAYLNIDAIIAHARDAGVQGVHPGYGYLSENPAFARRLAQEGLALLGPSALSMEVAGDKDIAKLAFQRAGVPVVPGTERGYTDVEGLVTEVRDRNLRYPLRLKAVGGGGGRGQATVHSEAELRGVFGKLSSEAMLAFSNGAIMAERFVPRFQHIEFQIMADRFGNVIHLGERECTLQMREQKLIEIHPAQILERFPGLRERMAEASINAARAVGYTGHGTVEFMVDPTTGEYFAMEVNARIQVEHRVSEAVTDFDLIRESVRLARGLPLSVNQEQIPFQRAAVEVRVKAVRAAGTLDHRGRVLEQDQPMAGTVNEFFVPNEPGVFVETSVGPGDPVSPHADPMIAKIIATGANRGEALRRMIDVLSRTRINGPEPFSTDLARNLALLRTHTVMRGDYDNRFVGEWTKRGGEDRARFLHTERDLVSLGEHSSAFAHIADIEVGAHEPFPPQLFDIHREALLRLFHGEEDGNPHRLTGVIAERIRQDAALRENLASRGNWSRGVWIQMGLNGEIRQLVVYQNQRPVRALLANQVSLPPAEYIPGTRPAPQPTSVAYDLIFNEAENRLNLNRAALYSHENGNIIARGEIQPGIPPTGQFFQALSDGSGFDLFTPSAEVPHLGLGRLQELGLKVRRTVVDGREGIEARDREGNLLLSLTPAEINERRQLEHIIHGLATLDAADPLRQHAIEEVGRTPYSVIPRLLELMRDNADPRQRALIGEMMAYREIVGFLNRHRIRRYWVLDSLSNRKSSEPQDPPPSAVLFDNLPTDSDTGNHLRIMIRSCSGSKINYLPTFEEAVLQLTQVMAAHPEARDNVIQVIVERSELLSSDDVFVQHLAETINTAVSDVEGDLALKRVTVIVDRRDADYPDYYTFRRAGDAQGQRTATFVEDTRYRNVHPMLGHFLELPRLANFDIERQNQHSNRRSHIYLGRNKATPTLKAGQDTRLFALGLVPEATIDRSSGDVEIPRVEEGFRDLVRGLGDAVAERGNKAPHWNRMFLSIQPVMEATDVEATEYAIRLAERHWDRLSGLGLEKVVVKARLRDPRLPEGYRTVLIRITNPSERHFEAQLHKVVRARVTEADGRVVKREVLVHKGVFDHWLTNPEEPIPYEASIQERYFDFEGVERFRDRRIRLWHEADIPIRPATPEEIREHQALSRGVVPAYRVPVLYRNSAQHFRVRMGLEAPASVEGSLRPPPVLENNFTELDLDLASVVRDPDTGMIDYNRARLTPALDAEGNPRPPWRNEAGVVIGIQTDNLGLGQPVRRMVIIGDATHSSRASFSDAESARINAAIQMAMELGIPVDTWVTSGGAAINREQGPEVLDAVTSTFRSISHAVYQSYRRYGRPGVPMNFVLDDYSIGIMSYDISIAAMAEETGGVVIFTPRGSSGLTGTMAFTAAANPTTPFRQLPALAGRWFPNGNTDMAGYRRVHGPNGEGTLHTDNAEDASDVLMSWHGLTYSPNGELAARRPWAGNDPYDRDFTVEEVAPGRTVADEIRDFTNRQQDSSRRMLEVARALLDQDAPQIQLWRDFRGLRFPAAMEQPGKTFDKPDDDPVNKVPGPFRPRSRVVAGTIGGFPVILRMNAGNITPGDSWLNAMAGFKAHFLGVADVPFGDFGGFMSQADAMMERQLTWGGKMGRVATEGGITVVVNAGRSVGGTKVVLSKQLRPPEEQDQHRVIAVSDPEAGIVAREQVIDGISGETVIFRRENTQAADRHPEVVAARAAVRAGTLSAAEAEVIYDRVLDEILKGNAARVDAHHTVERALSVHSIDAVSALKNLRAEIISQLELAHEAHQKWKETQALQAQQRELQGGMAEALNNPALVVGAIRALAEQQGWTPEETRARLGTLRGILAGLDLFLTPGPASGSGSGGPPEGGSAPP